MRYPTMIFHFNDQARPRRAAGRQAGGTFLGIILGISSMQYEDEQRTDHPPDAE